MYCFFSPHEYELHDKAKGKRFEFLFATCKKCNKLVSGAFPFGTTKKWKLKLKK